jgi:O-succinylbenzoate synthase
VSGGGPVLRADRLVLRELRMPLRHPFRISSGEMSDRRVFLLELHHPDGEVGWGECVAATRPNYSPETVDTAWLAITRWLAERVLGRSFEGAREVAPVLAEDIRGHPMARAAIEMTFWELEARLRGQPLSRLLGGQKDRVAAGISLGIETSPAALVEKVLAGQEEGYRRIKVKIEPGRDVDYVAAAREALGPEAALSADANAAYGRGDADHLAELDAFELVYLEQPLEPADLLGLARLQARLRTPLCLDESIKSAARAADMLELDAGRVVNLKPGRVGGFSSSLAIHDLCVERSVPLWCGGMLESGIGRAHNVALASLPGFTLPGDLSASRRYWERDIVEPEWTLQADGTLAVPLDRPGMGVDVDRDRIEDLTVRREVLEA